MYIYIVYYSFVHSLYIIHVHIHIMYINIYIVYCSFVHFLVLLNSLPYKPVFYRILERSLLVTSIFSFSHNVFYSSQDKVHFSSHSYLSSAKSFKLDWSEILSFGYKGLTAYQMTKFRPVIILAQLRRRGGYTGLPLSVCPSVRN